jgi:hypothetical protein
MLILTKNRLLLLSLSITCYYLVVISASYSVVTYKGPFRGCAHTGPPPKKINKKEHINAIFLLLRETKNLPFAVPHFLVLSETALPGPLGDRTHFLAPSETALPGLRGGRTS